MGELGSRIANLERAAPPDDRDRGMIELCLTPDLCARIEAARAAGSFPEALSDDDLRALLSASRTAGGHT